MSTKKDDVNATVAAAVAPVAQAVSEEDAAFLAEMKSTESDSDVVVIQPAVAAEAAAPAASDVVDNNSGIKEVIDPPVPERKEVIAGYTEEEIRAAMEQLPKLQRALDTTNGTFGSRLAEQQKMLERLQVQRSNVAGSLTSDKLSRLGKEFPEVARLLAEDLNEFITQGAPQDGSKIENFISTKLSEVDAKIASIEQAREIKYLSKAHPDWKQTASFSRDQDGFVQWANPEFGKWVESQPQDIKSRIVSEWDADFVTEQLTAFKEHAKPKVVEKKQSAVLENAIIPQGAGAVRTAASALSEEERAFREEMLRA